MAMLSVASIEQILAEVSYRPGWTFSVFETEFEGPHVRIEAPVVNGYRDGETVDLGINSPLPPFASEAELLRWLSWRLRRIEAHESREFLRYRGELVSDPHIEPA